MAPATVGPLASDIVLRGGYLAKPEVIVGLRVVEGAKYLSLWKGSPELNKFLTKASVCKRPLASSATIATIASKRNVICQELVEKLQRETSGTAASGHEGASAASGLGDLSVELELDSQSSSNSEPPAKKRRAMTFKACVHSLQKVIQVSMDVPGQEHEWTFRVLVEPPTRAPSLEATAQNLEMLWRLVDRDLQQKREALEKASCPAQVLTSSEDSSDAASLSPGAAKRPRAAPHEPRGLPDARQYWIASKQRWVQKIRCDAAQSGRPYARKYRTRIMGNGGRGRRAAAGAPAAPDDDCLG